MFGVTRISKVVGTTGSNFTLGDLDLVKRVRSLPAAVLILGTKTVDSLVSANNGGSIDFLPRLRITRSTKNKRGSMFPIMNKFYDALGHNFAFSVLKSREKTKDDSSRLRCFNEPEVTNARMDFFCYRV